MGGGGVPNERTAGRFDAPVPLNRDSPSMAIVARPPVAS